MPLSALQYGVYPAAQQFKSGTGGEGEKMKKSPSAVLFLSLLLCGYECFLPDGNAPEGGIVENLPQGSADVVMDYRRAVDFFINELIRETMIHCPGGKVIVDADPASARAAEFLVRKSGELSGVSCAGRGEKGALRLISRVSSTRQWQLELRGADGSPIWKKAVSISQ